MATAKKLPSGNWRVQASANGVHRSFTGATKQEAQMMAAEWQAMNNQPSADITLREAFERYINSKTAVLSPNTIREYRTKKDRILQGIMYQRIGKLTQEQIQIAINEEAATHSPKTVRDIHGMLSAVLRMFRPGFIVNTKLPQKKPPKITVPEEEDIKKIIAAAKGTDMELPILLAALGPMRRGGILAITDADVKGNSITVNKSIAINDKRERVEKSPKTVSSYRTILFPDYVISLTRGKKGRLVNMSDAMLYKRFQKILKKAGVTHLRFHDLRHYNVSFLHALGIPEQYIMARGGWATNATMNRVYRHEMKKARTEADEKIINSFNGMF